MNQDSFEAFMCNGSWLVCHYPTEWCNFNMINALIQYPTGSVMTEFMYKKRQKNA